MAKNCGEFVMRCFHARTNAHVLHLQTRSYAVHKALNEFYEEIIPLTDKFAEVYQGDYGIIEDYPPTFTMPETPLGLLDDLSLWIEASRYGICDEDDTYLQNIIDEIMALIRETQYKLKFLK